MTRIVEAVYQNGMFKPLEATELPEAQRVRLIVQTVDQPQAPGPEDVRAALVRAREIADAMRFRSTAPYPGREELHERR